MRAGLNDDRGIALISAILLMSAIFAIGLGITAWANTQQSSARYERTRESSFNIAEAALNAQIFQLSRAWPAAAGGAAACDPTTTAAPCPAASDLANFTGPDYTGTNAACGNAPLWQVQVRDNDAGYGATQTYNSALQAATTLNYDRNRDNTVWVRATGTAQCHPQTIVTLVARDLVPLDMPSDAIAANWFATGNQGKKVLVDTLGTAAAPPGAPAAQRADLVLRCSGLTDAQCKQYDASKGQVAPDSTQINRALPAQTLGPAQLDSLRQQAVVAGTYYAAGTCPSATSLSSPAAGVPVFVEGPCNLSVGSNSVINSAASPGMLVIANGSLALGGAARFYGIVYDINCQPSMPGVTPSCTPSTAALVSLGGTALIQGEVFVDGPGGVSVGSSKQNVVYDARVASMVRQYSGASVSRNSWRVLPVGQ